jgi:hypothetical protein
MPRIPMADEDRFEDEEFLEPFYDEGYTPLDFDDWQDELDEDDRPGYHIVDEEEDIYAE